MPKPATLEGPDQARLQGPDRDAATRPRRAPAISTSPPGCSCMGEAGGLEVHGRAAREHRAVHRTPARSPACRPPRGECVIGISFDMRGASEKTKGAPIDLIVPEGRPGLGPRGRRHRQGHQEPRRRQEARRLGRHARRRTSSTPRTSRSSRSRASRTRRRTIRPTTRSALVKNDFDWMAEEPRPHPGRVDQALRRQDGAEEVTRGDPRRMPDARQPKDPSLRHRGMTGVDEHARYLRAPQRISQALRRLHGAERHLARCRRGRVRLLPRALGLRQDHAAARHRRARAAERRHDPAEAGATSRACRRPQRDFGIVFQSYALFPNLTRRRQRRLRPGQPPRRAAREIARARRRAAGAGRPARRRAEVSRRSSPAASSSASRSRARSRPRPACCCSTSRCRRSMRACALRLRARDQRAAAPARRHHHHGDARPGRGAADGRPHRGDEPGRDRAGRHAAGDLPRAGDARSSPTSSAR